MKAQPKLPASARLTCRWRRECEGNIPESTIKAKLLLPTLLLIPALCACSNSNTADGAPTPALAVASTTGTTHGDTTSIAAYAGKWGMQGVLDRTAPDTFAATRDGIVVQFTLIPAGHARLSIKGHNAKGNVDLEMPLITVNSASAD